MKNRHEDILTAFVAGLCIGILIGILLGLLSLAL